ncbi:MAG: VCBS repeat-containing protein [Acidobacteriota bacterium]
MATTSSNLLSDDPTVDGWESEAASEKIDKRLKRLATWLADPSQVPTEELQTLADAAFRGSSLRPQALQQVVDSDTFHIERAEDLGTNEAIHRNRRGFVAAMQTLRQPYDGAGEVRAELKLFHIELSQQSIVTRQYVSISGVDTTGPVEEHATWLSHWTRGEQPQLQSLILEDYERARAKAQAPLFSDCTESVLRYRIAADELLGRPLPHWYRRIESRFGQSPLGYHGLSLGDVNGDGLEDLYLANPGGLPNRLFVQNPNGTVTERSADAGVDWMTTTMSSLFVDLDNDGDQDLIVGSSPQIVMENDGQGQFEPRQTLPGTAIATSIVAADPDADGDLDLYVCYYSSNGPVPIHDANNGPPNTLWRNDGDWNFSNVTRDIGLDENNARFSFAAAWEDYDNDGDQDLYVANDYGRNNLYRNDGGRFRDVAPQAEVEDISAGMSVTFGDYNRDGWMDLYVSNMFSSAGNRITYQRRFNPAAQGAERATFQRHARGNSLFRGGPDGRFTDVSEEAGVTMGRWAWASLFMDIDNDGLEDLVVANGNLTNDNPKDL